MAVLEMCLLECTVDDQAKETMTIKHVAIPFIVTYDVCLV